MTNNTDRQLKELRRLMPWNWDARVEDHPPGEKAMHDFENVLSYQFEQRRRRAPRSLSTIKPVKRQLEEAPSVEAALKKMTTQQLLISLQPYAPESEAEAITKPPCSEKKCAQAQVTATDDVAPFLPKSTTCVQPAAVRVANSTQNHTTIIENISNQGANAMGRPIATPTPARKFLQQTPSSRPSTSRNHAALADGQFVPTPVPTPATVAGTNTKIIAATAFRSPRPRLTTNKIYFHEKEEMKACALEDIRQSVHNHNEDQHNGLYLKANKDGKLLMTHDRRDSCPPLFLQSAHPHGVNTNTKSVLSMHQKSLTQRVDRFPPLPPPSAQKTSQAATIGTKFYVQEKEIVAFMNNNKDGVAGEQHQFIAPKANKGGEYSFVRPMPLVKPVGAALGWAIAQLRNQQKQQNL